MSATLTLNFCPNQEVSLVEVAGSFNNWTKVAMRRDSDKSGEWSISMNVTPGQHEYKYCVDQEWRHDPKYSTTDDNFGGLNNIVIVSGEKEGQEKLKREEEEKLLMGIEPDSLVLDGDESETAQLYGCRLGLYLKKTDNTYQQAGGDHSLVKGSDGTWFIDQISNSTGQKDSNVPPTDGWEFNFMGRWRSDSRLKIVNPSNLKFCKIITVSSTTYPLKEFLGEYHVVPQEWLSGKPVFRNRAGKYLRVPSNCTNWVVSDEKDSTTNGFIQTGRATFCPSSKMSRINTVYGIQHWQYKEVGYGGTYKNALDDKTLNIKCDVHG